MKADDRRDSPVEIARFAYRHEGEMARGYLEDAGVFCMLFADDASGIEVGLTFVNPARLLVHPNDVDRAREVLRAAGLIPDMDGS